MAGRIEAIVEELARPLVESQGLELVDVEWVKEGANRYLRLYIDQEGGVTLDHCEAVSRLVGEKLDEVDPIPQSYIFEVSSPGLERPLKKPRDFERYKGATVALTTYAPVEGEKRFVGELLGFVDGVIHLRMPAQGAQPERELSFEQGQVAQVRLHFEV